MTTRRPAATLGRPSLALASPFSSSFHYTGGQHAASGSGYGLLGGSGVGTPGAAGGGGAGGPPPPPGLLAATYARFLDGVRAAVQREALRAVELAAENRALQISLAKLQAKAEGGGLLGGGGGGGPGAAASTSSSDGGYSSGGDGGGSSEYLSAVAGSEDAGRASFCLEEDEEDGGGGGGGGSAARRAAGAGGGPRGGASSDEEDEDDVDGLMMGGAPSGVLAALEVLHQERYVARGARVRLRAPRSLFSPFQLMHSLVFLRRRRRGGGCE